MSVHSVFYIDYENMADIKFFPPLENGRYVILVGAKQQFQPNGIKCRIIRSKGAGKDRLDCELIEALLNRIRTMKNTKHIIVAKDKGYDTWVSFFNSKYGAGIVERRESLP